MKKMLLSLVALMFVTGCYDEHYWDANYIIEKYCSMDADRITCNNWASYSTCVDTLKRDLESRVEDYPNCSEEISQAFLAKYRNMADEDSCLDWDFKKESEYADEGLIDKAQACKEHYYPRYY